VDLKLVLHLYRARFFLLTGNLKASKQEIKSAQNLSQDHLPALLLKAQLEYSQGNYHKVMKQLTASSSSSARGEPGSLNVMLLSNLGCIYLVSGKSRLLLFTSQKLCILSLVHISANPNQCPNFLKTGH
jgi:CCR4-NOT transcription complex subunit 10